MRTLILAAITVFAGAYPLSANAQASFAKVRQDIIESRETLPMVNGQVMTSLCDTATYKGMPPHLNQVIELAQKGNSVAECSLGVAYQRGYVGGLPDEETAKVAFQKSAAQGNAAAQELLGEIYENGEHVGQDFDKATAWFQKFYNNKDRIEADKWAHKAPSQGNSQTLCDDTAYSVKPPQFDALRALADKGDAVAQCSLGVAYQRGFVDGKTDDATAKTWLEKSADQGNAKAEYLLATLYEDGERVQQDGAEAYKWYAAAAEQGNIRAQTKVAEVFLNGSSGMAQNDAEALKWYRRAAEQGDMTGADFLAEFYRTGTHGIARDPVHAYMWALIAIRMRAPANNDAEKKAYDEQAKQLTAAYQQGMTPEQISQGDALAGLWVPKHEQTYLFESVNDMMRGK